MYPIRNILRSIRVTPIYVATPLNVEPTHNYRTVSVVCYIFGFMSQERLPLNVGMLTLYVAPFSSNAKSRKTAAICRNSNSIVLL